MSKIEQNKLKNLPITAKNEEQKEAIKTIIECDLSCILGSSGTGKSFLTIGLACEHLMKDKIEKLLITRPMVCCGKQLGSLPGGVLEKFEPFYLPVMYYLEMFLGERMVKKMMDEKRIILKPLELLRGSNWTDTYILADEMENATFNQIVMLVSRMSSGSKVIMNADLAQWDIGSSKQTKFETDLEFLIDKIGKLDGFSVVWLKECLRSDFVGRFLRAVKN